MPSEGLATKRPWPSLYPLALCLSLAVSCLLVARSKAFWNDELFSLYVLGEPHLSGMWAAFSDRLNNAPPAFFLIGWGWVRVFGAGELSLRLYSWAGMALALWCTFSAIRTRHSAMVAAVAVGFVFGLTPLILDQNAEARMYGLFMGFVAAASWQAIAFDAQSRPSRRSLAGTAAVHALLVNTHLFGALYSLAIAGASAWGGAQRRHWPTSRLLAIGAGQLTLLAYVPAFLHQADAVSPRGWILPPTLADLFDVLVRTSPATCLVLAASAAVALAFRLARGARHHGSRSPTLSVFLFADMRVAVMLLAVVPAAWLLSLAIRPVFVDRYMLPSLIGLALLVACVADGAKHARGTALRLMRTGVVLVVFASLAYPVIYARQRPAWPFRGRADAEAGFPSLPIVVPSSHLFLPRMHYGSPELRARYVFLLDWPDVLPPDNGSFPPQEQKHLQSFRARWPDRFGGAIAEADTFLAQHETFLVVQSAGRIGAKCVAPRPWWSLQPSMDWDGRIYCPQILERRVFANPAYVYEALPRLSDGTEMLLVRLANGRP